jgi:hypothetical protein
MSEKQVSGYKNVISNLDNLLGNIKNPERKKRLEEIMTNLKKAIKNPKGGNK